MIPRSTLVQFFQLLIGDEFLASQFSLWVLVAVAAKTMWFSAIVSVLFAESSNLFVTNAIDFEWVVARFAAAVVALWCGYIAFHMHSPVVTPIPTSDCDFRVPASHDDLRNDHRTK